MQNKKVSPGCDAETKTIVKDNKYKVIHIATGETVRKGTFSKSYSPSRESIKVKK